MKMLKELFRKKKDKNRNSLVEKASNLISFDREEIKPEKQFLGFQKTLELTQRAERTYTLRSNACFKSFDFSHCESNVYCALLDFTKNHFLSLLEALRETFEKLKRKGKSKNKKLL